MFDRIRFQSHFDKSRSRFLSHFDAGRFAEALACCERGGLGGNPYEHMALYRLGLYRSAAAIKPSARDWRSLFSAAVSLAACGEAAEAAAYLKNASAARALAEHRIPLAAALAPFAPALAVSLMPDEAPPVLKAALWLRVGQAGRALACLEMAMAGGQQAPELALFHSNAARPGPEVQLANLNAFLDRHSVAPLALRDPTQPPGAMNVLVAEDLPPVRGSLVSILMTAFRSAGRIASAIESLLAQTYRDIEVIVVDDASDDDTAAVVEGIAARDARVRLVRLPVNVGTYVAKSVGLNLARGEFVTCHDSDDWAHPQKIALQMQPFLADEGVVFTTSNWLRMQDDGVFYARLLHPLMRINPASPLFRKSVVLAKAGGWDWVRTGADSEFLARLKLVFGRKGMRRIQKPLTIGAHRDNSLMNAAATGYNEQGMSPDRLDYWEAWGHWHIDALRAGHPPRMPADMLGERPFVAPPAIGVPREAIARCLAAFSG